MITSRAFGRKLAGPMAAALLLAACATRAPVAEVSRFHLGQPIPADSITLVQDAAGQPLSAEYEFYASAMTPDLAAAGLRRVAGDPRSAYVGVLKVEQAVREGPPKPPPFQLGFGGSSGGYGGGVGGGVSIPIGKRRTGDVRVNQLSLQIKRRSDNSVVWEGRAVSAIAADAPASALTAAVPGLSQALLAGFPGPTGQTVLVKLPQRGSAPRQ